MRYSGSPSNGFGGFQEVFHKPLFEKYIDIVWLILVLKVFQVNSFQRFDSSFVEKQHCPQLIDEPFDRVNDCDEAFDVLAIIMFNLKAGRYCSSSITNSISRDI
jgi:hypothetical protein